LNGLKILMPGNLSRALGRETCRRALRRAHVESLMSSRSEPNGLQVERLAQELTQKVYHLTKKPGFAKDYGLKRQIQDAAGSSMHNIAEGFDSETNAEFIRFLRYAKRSCTEVQTCPPPARSCLAMAGGSLSLRRGGRGELYVALDEKYISPKEFKNVYEQARRTRAAARGFINYSFDLEALDRLKKYEEHKPTNPEP